MNIADALYSLDPDASWSLYGDDYADLVWHGPGQKPTLAEVEAAAATAAMTLAWRKVRAERDRLLAASDWTQVADAPVDSAAWAVYRQALRDIPQDFATPDAVVWPTPPS